MKGPGSVPPIIASSKSLLGKAGLDPGPDDRFEIEWLEQ